MGKVVMYGSVSVDGFVADENDQPGPLFDWLSSGDVPLDESGMLTSRMSRSGAVSRTRSKQDVPSSACPTTRNRGLVSSTSTIAARNSG